MFLLRDIVVSNQIVNLTGSPFNMYEESTGNIYTLVPSVEELPMLKFSEGIRPTTYYVVKEETIRKLQKSNRTLDDIAYICDRGSGYAKIPICTLASAAKPRVLIKLRRYDLVFKYGKLPDDAKYYVKLT